MPLQPTSPPFSSNSQASGAVPPPPPRKKGMSGCLIALLVMAGIIGVAVLGGAFLIYQYSGTLMQQGAAFILDSVTEQVVSSPALSEEEKVRVKKSLDQISQRIRSGEISVEEATQIATEVAQSQFFSVVIASAVLSEQLKNLRLTPEEMESAELTVRRFVVGSMSGAIPNEKFEAVFNRVTVQKKDAKDENDRELRQDMTPEEIRSVLNDMKQDADNAKVPTDLTSLDIAATLEQAIEAGLKKHAEGDSTP